MSNGNDPSRNDPPEVETIQDVRDWYSDPNHIGLPPGCVWVDRDNEIIQLPNGEQWQWCYGTSKYGWTEVTR